MQRLSAGVDAAWRSPVADAVVRAWGIPAGRATFWRSSGTHVFVVAADDRSSKRFVRFVPDSHRSLAAVSAAARFTCDLDRGGVPVAAPIPSLGGALVESVATTIGLVHTSAGGRSTARHGRTRRCVVSDGLLPGWRYAV